MMEQHTQIRPLIPPTPPHHPLHHLRHRRLLRIPPPSQHNLPPRQHTPLIPNHLPTHLMHRALRPRLLQKFTLVQIIPVFGRAHPSDTLEAGDALLRFEGVEDSSGELVAGAVGGVAAELVVVDAAFGGRGGGGEGAEMGLE